MNHNTGKTYTNLSFVYDYCRTFPRSKIVLVRNVRADLSETVLAEWEDNVLGPGHYLLRHPIQRDNREKYTFNNGSEVICRGFDRDAKLFSGQYHGVLFNEAVELRSEDKWERLHRAVRAPLLHPGQFRFLLAECNPAEEFHWINERAKTGRMHRIQTYLWDNPRWFDHAAGEWTSDGEEYIGNLSRGLSGHNRERLLLGNWFNATGAVLPEFNRDVHEPAGSYDPAARMLSIAGWPEPVKIEWTFGAMDAGYEGAGVFGVWGIDREGRMFCLCEVYRSHWTHDDWVRCIFDLAGEFKLQGMVCDHDKALIEAINRAFLRISATPFARIADKTLGLAGTKGKAARIGLMRSRLQRNAIFWMRDCNRHVDERLIALKRPWKTTMELPRLRHDEFEYGEDPIANAERIDPRADDHGFDQSLYGISYAESRAVRMSAVPEPPKPGTARAIFGPKPWEVQRRRRA